MNSIYSPLKGEKTKLKARQGEGEDKGRSTSLINLPALKIYLING